MKNPLKGFAIGLISLGAIFAIGPLHAKDEAGILRLGEAVVTHFSGVVDPATPAPAGSKDLPLDETFINLEGASARIASLANPAFVWDARVWPGETLREFKAKEIGQVFGVTVDDDIYPNIYVTATSAYGLQIVAPDVDGDGRPERLHKGDKSAQWMAGQWGATDVKDPPGEKGGPGSIWRIDGKTGEVSLFANVKFQGKDNSGASLGNITYAPAFKQLFVSDLSTGLIHRFSLDGAEIETFDHGVAGRPTAKLKPLSYDAKSRLDIAKKDFDPEDPETYGFTDEDRRVYGLAFNAGRLYYAVVGDSQIWSVGFHKDTGKFIDPRWELDVPKTPTKLPVSDIVFTHKGAMVLAQRANIKSVYDYGNFAEPEKARVYRFWLETPDNLKTPSRWIAEPEEYPVGFNDKNRATDGGLALNYGYDRFGYMDMGMCEATLWTTGDNLRNGQGEDLVKALSLGGSLLIDGLQGMPAGPVKDKNTPPWASYQVDINPANTPTLDGAGKELRWSDKKTSGWMGDIATYRVGCGGSGGVAGAPGYYGGAGYGWTWPPYIPPGSGYCPPGQSCGGTGGGSCTPGVDCPEPPPYCARPAGEFICDEKTGEWYFALTTGLNGGSAADTVVLTNASPGAGASQGTSFPISNGAVVIPVGSTLYGQLINLNICLFNQAAADSGRPFDCCKAVISIQAPAKRCVKK